MLEPRPDMLPDESLTQPEVSEDLKTQEEETESEDVVSPEPSQKGSKTPDNKLYAALEEERTKRKNLEMKVKQLEESSISSDILDEDSLSIEGKVLKREIDTLKGELSSLKDSQTLKDVYSKFPVLTERKEEFDEFRNEKSHYSLDDAAELFIAKRGLYEPPKRKGLEKSTGGQPTEEKKMSNKDIDLLMKTDHRKFIKMAREGVMEENFR